MQQIMRRTVCCPTVEPLRCGVGIAMTWAARYQSGMGSDFFHKYLKNPTVSQHDTVSTVYEVAKEQQDWYNTRQWKGYSAAYLKPPMAYKTAVENRYNETPKEVQPMLAVIYRTYGVAAEILNELEDDVLDPQFHEKVEKARSLAKELENEIDLCYKDAHPTFKVAYDAWMVSRLMTLHDWVLLVQKKREELLATISPQWIEKQQELKSAAERHLSRLRQVKRAFEEDPVFYLDQSAPGLTDAEKAVVRQRVQYFRNMKLQGAIAHRADMGL